MQVTPQQLRIGATVLGTGVLGAGATHAWAGADRSHPGRERVAAAAYAPGVIGGAVAAVTGPVAIGAKLLDRGLARFGIAATRPASIAASWGRVAGFGAAAAAGMAVGTALTRTTGAEHRRAVYPDAALPEPNMRRAHTEATEAWNRLDRASPNLVVWVPGTMRNRIPHEFKAGVAASFDDASLVNLPARPDYQVPQGVADSAAALRELLVRLDANREPGQRIMLAGESQGAWAIGVAMQDPVVADIVDRAALWGNPGVSPHQFDGAGDGQVLELTDELDVVGRTLEGDAPMMLDGLTDTFDGDVSSAWRVPATMINNPFEAGLITQTGVRLAMPGGYGRDPHNHREFMGIAARFLADAPVPDEG